LALLLGTFGGFLGAVIVTPVWAAFIAGLTAWSATHRATFRGMPHPHGAVIFSSMALWGVTLIVGLRYFTDELGWWLGGGVAMALPGLLGAVVVFRRTRG
jgi:hypothetical protein